MFTRLISTCFVLTMVLSPGSAQEAGRKIQAAPKANLQKVTFPGGSCDLYLLAQELVQHDLDLSDKQVARVREIVADLIAQHKKVPFATFVQQLEKSQATALEQLSKEQLKRLKQISLQCGATASLSRTEVRHALQITDDQIAKIRSIPYPRELEQDIDGDLAAIAKEFLSYPKRAEKEWQQREWQTLAVLTPKQREQWKAMLGQPFKGTFPSTIYISAPAAPSPAPAVDPAFEAVRAEIKTLRERIKALEKKLAELEKAKK